MAEQRGGGGAGLFRARRRGARGEVVGLIGCLRIFGHIRLDDVRDARRRAEEEEPGQQPSAEDRQRGLNENGAENRRVMSQNPESVPFVRRALQFSRPDELWSTLAGHAAVANRCSYSICFTWVRQVMFFSFFYHQLCVNDIKCLDNSQIQQ